MRDRARGEKKGEVPSQPKVGNKERGLDEGGMGRDVRKAIKTT